MTKIKGAHDDGRSAKIEDAGPSWSWEVYTVAGSRMIAGTARSGAAAMEAVRKSGADAKGWSFGVA